MIYIVLDNQKASKNTFQATTFKAEENSRAFQKLPLEFKDFSRLCEPWDLFRAFAWVANVNLAVATALESTRERCWNCRRWFSETKKICTPYEPCLVGELLVQ